MNNIDKDFVTGAHRPTRQDGGLVHIERPIDVSSKIGQVGPNGVVGTRPANVGGPSGPIGAGGARR
jgi:hypothetical protein